MQDTIKFNQNFNHIIKENVGVFLFDVNAIKADDSVCDIANLNEVLINISIKRAGENEFTEQYSGFLDDLLAVLYTQSTELDLVKKKLASGYKIAIKYGLLGFYPQKGDELRIKGKFPATAFTAVDLAKSNINIETLPPSTSQRYGVMSKYDTYHIGAGEQSFEKNLGDNVVKVVLIQDLTANYNDSNKAKPTDVQVRAMNFNKEISETALEYENQHLLKENPDSNVKNLVLLQSEESKQDVSVKIQFDAVVDADAKVMVMRLADI